MADLGTLELNFRARLDKLEDEMARARSKVTKAAEDMGEDAGNSFSSKLEAAAPRMRRAGAAMSLSLTAPLTLIGKSALETAANFETTMNTMAAVAEVPGHEMVKLGELAKEMGAKTVFSAGEAAEAMLELAKAGVTTADITGGALAASLDLAAVEGMELAAAATVVANALNTFKLRGDQAGEVADALAGASKASSASVNDMAFAFQMGGSAASAAGLTVQEFSAYLAAMANAGIKGSDAGTSVKTMLMNLQPTTKKASNAMRDLGLDFVDANGNFLAMRDIAGQLQQKLGPLAEAERLMALEVIFGSDAMRAANVLVNEGAAGFDKLLEATTKAGTAQELASARMSGTSGALERMRGSLETASLAIGTALAPVVEKVAGFVERMANAFTQLPGPVQAGIVAFAGLVAVVGPLLVIVGMMIPAVTAVAGVFSSVIVPVLAVIAVLALIGAAVYLVITHWDTLKEATAAAWEWVKAKVGEAVDSVKGFFDDLVAGALRLRDQIRNVVDGVIGFFSRLASAAGEKVGEVVDWFQALPGRILGVLAGLPGALWDMGVSIVRGLINGIASMARAVLNALLDLIPGPLKRFANLLGIGSPSKVFAGFGMNIGQGLAIGMERSRELVMSASETLAQAASGQGIISLAHSGDGAASAGASSSAGAQPIQVGPFYGVRQDDLPTEIPRRLRGALHLWS